MQQCSQVRTLRRQGRNPVGSQMLWSNGTESSLAKNPNMYKKGPALESRRGRQERRGGRRAHCTWEQGGEVGKGSPEEGTSLLGFGERVGVQWRREQSMESEQQAHGWKERQKRHFTVYPGHSQESWMKAVGRGTEVYKESDEAGEVHWMTDGNRFCIESGMRAAGVGSGKASWERWVGAGPAVCAKQ